MAFRCETSWECIDRQRQQGKEGVILTHQPKVSNLKDGVEPSIDAADKFYRLRLNLGYPWGMLGSLFRLGKKERWVTTQTCRHITMSS